MFSVRTEENVSQGCNCEIWNGKIMTNLLYFYDFEYVSDFETTCAHRWTNIKIQSHIYLYGDLRCKTFSLIDKKICDSLYKGITERNVWNVR